jgi:hypothetical protein
MAMMYFIVRATSRFQPKLGCAPNPTLLRRPLSCPYHESPANSNIPKSLIDVIVFPTDFPRSFTFERFVEAVKGFLEREELPADLSPKILWDNPKRLYRI